MVHVLVPIFSQRIAQLASPMFCLSFRSLRLIEFNYFYRGSIVNIFRIVGRIKPFATALLVSVAFSSVAFGQASTGGLKITATDSSGAPISGANVSASSAESLGQKSGLTDANGEIRFAGLDPSNDYTVTVSAAGYQGERHQNVQVTSQRTFDVPFVLNSSTDSSLEEIVTYGRTDLGQIIDTSSATMTTDVTLEMTESLPTGRNYQAYLQLAPTTKPTIDGNPSSKSGVNYSDRVDANGNVYGTSSDNVYYIDGINITDNQDGVAGANFNSEIIQEQLIITGGVPAEYAGGQGLISRVITKSGSNEFHGSVNYYAQNDSLVGDNDNLPDAGFSDYDAAFTFGGPIVKDKLWFFTSYQVKEQETDVVDPVSEEIMRTVDTKNTYAFAKLTWQMTENDRLVAEFFNDPYERNGSLNTTIVANRDVARDQGGDNWKIEYSHSWDNVIATINAVSHEGELSNAPADLTTRNDIAYLATADVTNEDLQKGGSGSVLETFRNREAVNFTLEWFAGDHEVKTGYSVIVNDYDENFVYTGPDKAQYSSMANLHAGLVMDQYIDATGIWQGERDFSQDDYQRAIDAMADSSAADQAYYLGLLDANDDGEISTGEFGQLQLNSNAGNPSGEINVYQIHTAEEGPTNFKTEGQTFYLQDSWHINDHWTINAGIRTEKWDHIATNGATVFSFDWDIAPRLSAIWDIGGDGVQKVWGFYGRYYDPIRTDMTTFAGTLTGSVREEKVFVGDRWLTFRVRGGDAAGFDGFFAPTTKTPYTDEIMFGYERALTPNQSLSFTYTNRVTEDIMEDYDLGFYTDPDAVGGYALPLEYFGFGEGGVEQPDANYFLATLYGAKREYEGIEVTWRKRRSADSNWFGLASYSYNDAEGNSNSDGNADLAGDFLYLDPRAPNVWGTQNGNVEHLLKLAGSYRWENGIEVGATYAWNSGTTYTESFVQYSRHTPIRVGEAYEDNGATQAWLAADTVGTQTTPSYGTLNLRLKYALDFGNRYTAEFFVDVFNALDDQAATRVQDLAAGDAVYDYNEESAWVLPRRFYLGARVSF
jgi:hypothetical protein